MSTVPGFPEVTTAESTDIVWLTRGAGADRDKKITVENLLGDTVDVPLADIVAWKWNAGTNATVATANLGSATNPSHLRITKIGLKTYAFDVRMILSDPGNEANTNVVAFYVPESALPSAWLDDLENAGLPTDPHVSFGRCGALSAGAGAAGSVFGMYVGAFYPDLTAAPSRLLTVFAANKVDGGSAITWATVSPTGATENPYATTTFVVVVP